MILELPKGDSTERLSGVLRDYTAEFILLMGAQYRSKEGGAAKEADLIAPRSIAVVRHLAQSPS